MLHRRVIALFAAVAAAAVAGVGLVVPAQAATAVVPDAAFAACLNGYLGQAADAPITAAQLGSLTGDDGGYFRILKGISFTGINCQFDGITSIEGAQYLTELGGLNLGGNQISDLSRLSGLANLTTLNLGDNQISDLTPLSGLVNLDTLNISANQISDLGPLAGLTKLTDLGAYSNQISDVAPLAGLTMLGDLVLRSNQISDVAPLAGLTKLYGLFLDTNQIGDVSPLAGLDQLYVLWLSANQVTDISSLAGLSSLDWSQVYGDGWGPCGMITDQVGSMVVTAGTAAALPVVSVSAVGPVTWKVASGTAAVSADGMVTMPAAGTATLTWTDANGYFTGTLTVTAVAPVLVSSVAVSPASATVLVGATTTVMATVAPSNATNPGVTWSSSDASVATVDANGVVTGVKAGTATITATAVDGSGKSGTATVTVTAPAPVPSVPGSTVVKSGAKASTTGGAARLANGKDAYTATVSVVDTDGNPLTGVASRLAVTAPAGVAISKITDNGDGTYSFTAMSAKPGNYKLTVTLDGTPVGSPISVNFIGATDPPTQQVGATQTATGLGFLPGEKVTVTVHSTPLSLGVFTADSAGMVQVSFPVPAGFADASHTVVFAGVTSGTVSASFAVPAQTLVPAGGTPVPGSPAAGFVFASFLTLAGGVLVRRLRTAR